MLRGALWTESAARAAQWRAAARSSSPARGRGGRALDRGGASNGGPEALVSVGCFLQLTGHTGQARLLVHHPHGSSAWHQSDAPWDNGCSSRRADDLRHGRSCSSNGLDLEDAHRAGAGVEHPGSKDGPSPGSARPAIPAPCPMGGGTKPEPNGAVAAAEARPRNEAYGRGCNARRRSERLTTAARDAAAPPRAAPRTARQESSRPMAQHAQRQPDAGRGRCLRELGPPRPRSAASAAWPKYLLYFARRARAGSRRPLEELAHAAAEPGASRR
jgi:hypothetical protein